MAKSAKSSAKKGKSKKSESATAANQTPKTSTAVSSSPAGRAAKINPFLHWAPLVGLPIGALAAAEIWDWRGGVKWMLALTLFIIGWRFMLQVANPNDPGAAS